MIGLNPGGAHAFSPMYEHAPDAPGSPGAPPHARAANTAPRHEAQEAPGAPTGPMLAHVPPAQAPAGLRHGHPVLGRAAGHDRLNLLRDQAPRAHQPLARQLAMPLPGMAQQDAPGAPVTRQGLGAVLANGLPGGAMSRSDAPGAPPTQGGARGIR